MNKPIVIIGMGEIGGVFARGFLKIGHPVYPVNRNTTINDIARNTDDVQAVIVAVGEKDLQATLENIPTQWKDKLVLLQNELLPKDWKIHGLKPTVVSVWFEKKFPNDYKVIIPSPVYGPKADLVAQALNSINATTRVVKTDEEMLQELVVKNAYILTTNIAGLEVGGNVGQLWKDHNEVALAVVRDVLDIQDWLTESQLDRTAVIDGMVAAFHGDLEHKCMGRSAPARLERAISQADESGLKVSKLREIYSKKPLHNL